MPTNEVLIGRAALVFPASDVARAAGHQGEELDAGVLRGDVHAHALDVPAAVR